MFDVYSGLKALAIIVSILAIGDFVSIKTKGTLSIMFVSSFLFIVAFLNGLPTDIFKIAGFQPIGNILVTILIVHLGTTLNTNTLKQQWKVVLISIGAEIGIIVSILMFGLPFFDKATTLASISPIGGGIVATLIVQKTAALQQLDEIVIYTSLLLSASGFVGYPIASYFLKKEAKQILSQFSEQEYSKSKKNLEQEEHMFNVKIIRSFFGKYSSSNIIFAKLAATAFLSFFIAKFSQNYINEYILCLVLGFIFKEIGFLDFDSLNKANSYGFASIAVITIVFQSFTNISMEIIAQLILPILFFLALGVLGMILFSLVIGKKLKYSKNLSISVGIACMFGFPGTYIIPHEVAKSLAKTEIEKEIILNGIYPQMLIAGFVNVTIASVIISGIIVRFM